MTTYPRGIEPAETAHLGPCLSNPWGTQRSSQGQGSRETFWLSSRSILVMVGELISERIRIIASGKCAPCKDAVPYTIEESTKRLGELSGWSLQSGSIQKEFRFKSYLSGLEFAHSLGKIAEQEDHHPEMLVGWRRVRVTFSTHTIKGLSQNDFIMAAKAELAYRTAHHRELENRKLDS